MKSASRQQSLDCQWDTPWTANGAIPGLSMGHSLDCQWDTPWTVNGILAESTHSLIELQSEKLLLQDQDFDAKKLCEYGCTD